MEPDETSHEWKIEYARASLWAPFYAVGIAARIRGDIPRALLETALRKLQTLHPPLASRVRVDRDGTAWLTTEGVGEFPLEVRRRVEGDDWAAVFLEQERIPFAFHRGPVARFFLLRGDPDSDIVAVAPHVICDGYSMAHAMGDLVALLNDPDRAVTRPAPPPAVTWQTLPHSASDGLVLRGAVRVLNRTWMGSRVFLDHEDYEKLHRCYWSRQRNGLLVSALSKAETAHLAASCKQHGVSVTGALVAFLLPQTDVQPVSQPARRQVSVAVNIRDRLTQSPGRALGVYASSVDVSLRRTSAPLWELARESQTRIRRATAKRTQILRVLMLQDVDPLIADGLVAAVCTDQWTREFAFLARLINVRGRRRCLNISNIGRMDLPELGAPYRVETLFPFPPLVPGGRLALNVLTVDGRMNLILKYGMDQMDPSDVARIRDRALNHLLGGGEG